MRRMLLLLMISIFAGCANTFAERQAQLATLIGRSELELVQLLGVPTQSYRTNGVTFLSYRQQQTQVLPASPWYYYGPMPGFYGGFPPQLVTWSCDTTFEVVENRVVNFTLRGNGCG